MDKRRLNRREVRMMAWIMLKSGAKILWATIFGERPDWQRAGEEAITELSAFDGVVKANDLLFKAETEKQ